MTNSTNEKCIFCGSDKNITREHAISKNLFPDNYQKTKLITVPSCRVCNESYSHEEELFRLFLVNQSTEGSRTAVDMLHGKITRAMKKNPKKAADILEKMFPVKLQLSDGNFEDKVAFHISVEDWRGHHRVLDKYVKALYYYHIGSTIPDNHEIKHLYISDPSKIPDEIKPFLNWNRDNEHIYEYAYACVQGSMQSTWTFIFYDTVIFQSFTVAPGELTKRPTLSKS